MKKLSFLVLFLALISCNKPKTILICGDHVCINKTEAKQYFEENMSLEVKIIDKKDKNEISLVELNLRDKNSKKKINIYKKKQTEQSIKSLSKKEIKRIKKEIKNKNERNKIVKKNINKKKDRIKIDNSLKNKNEKSITHSVDICTILKECNIDEISKYLIKQAKKKGFPDITIRE